MKVVICHARGSAEEAFRLENLDTPEPGPGEVRVAMHAIGVNPSDFKVRSGAQGPLPAPEIIPHNDGAGVIEAVGNGVSERRLGERVWLYNVNRSEDGMAQGIRGTAAEAVVVAEKYAAPLPHGVSFEEAACLGVPAMTAHRALFADGAIDGQWILVTGGAGAVGLSAIQMAKAAGARVIATVSSPEKADYAIQAGAEATINYRSESVPERVLELTGQQPVDRIIDLDLHVQAKEAARYIKQGGVIATYASADMTPSLDYRGLLVHNAIIRFVFVYALDDEARQAAIADINGFLRQGVLRPVIHRVMAMEEIIDAHHAVEAGGFIGNIVLSPR